MFSFFLGYFFCFFTALGESCIFAVVFCLGMFIEFVCGFAIGLFDCGLLSLLLLLFGACLEMVGDSHHELPGLDFFFLC